MPGADSDTTLRELASDLRFPEGPVVLPGGDVLVCELRGGAIRRVPKDGGEPYGEVVLGGSPNGAAIGPDGALYVCNSGGWRWTDMGGMSIPGSKAGTQGEDYTGGRIQRVDLSTGAFADLYTECDGRSLRAPNDIVFDASGGFWFTDHGHRRARDRDLGGLYYATADGSSITEAVYPLDAPNGVGLSPGGDRVYVAETDTGRVWWWPLDGPGRIAGEPRPYGHGGRLLFGAPGRDLFDSLAVDAGGHVCVATIGNGGVTVIAPDGSSVEHAALPDPIVTNVCFGGDDLRTAYVTLSAFGRLVAFEWPRPGLRLAFP